jgi:phosphonate transport system substrate-binding protein
MSEPRPALSFSRVLAVVLPVALVGGGLYWWSMGLESKAREEMSSNVFARILSSNATAGGRAMDYPDHDGDLVADSPDEPERCIAPEVLMFSFVAGEAESVPADDWLQLLSQLTEKTGREVKYIHYGTADEQLAALQKGELHIAGLNTGIVPTAVQRSGFVPVCTFGREDGTFGYTMKLLVPADSPVKEITDLRGRKITFTRPDSNSGCKVLLALLSDEYDMQPDRDYTWGFSLGHEESIKGVAAKDFEAAPVASDILARMVEQNEVDAAAFRSVHESERFPPATFGIVYNLTPELRDKIREALLAFELTGTGLEGEFGADATKLVPINYKQDWANARHIDQLVAQSRKPRSS